MDTIEKLNKLSEYQNDIEILKHDKQMIIDNAMAEFKDVLDEYDSRLNSVSGRIAELEAEIKQDVLHTGSTIKGVFIMAVYNKGRITWDNKGLEGFMVAHPEIVAFRKEGDPSVTLRKISNKGE